MAGLFHIYKDISRPHNKLFGLDSTVGLVYLQIGLLNLLNALYGSSKAGIRFAAVGINVLSTGLIIWTIILFAERNYTFFLLGIVTTTMLFSLFSFTRRTSES